VQWVNRPNADFRGYYGTVASGSVQVGDELGMDGAEIRRKNFIQPDQFRQEIGDAMDLPWR